MLTVMIAPAGIGPCYTSKVTRNAVRVGMLRNPAAFRKALTQLVEDTKQLYDVSAMTIVLIVIVVIVVVVVVQ